MRGRIKLMDNLSNSYEDALERLTSGYKYFNITRFLKENNCYRNWRKSLRAEFKEAIVHQLPSAEGTSRGQIAKRELHNAISFVQINRNYFLDQTISINDVRWLIRLNYFSPNNNPSMARFLADRDIVNQGKSINCETKKDLSKMRKAQATMRDKNRKHGKII